MDSRVNRAVAVVLAIVVVTTGAVVAIEVFAPEQATQVNESASTTSENPSTQAVKSGTFSGHTGHQVSGTVTIFKDEEGYYLQFENYSQTQGPDVFVYLTPAENPETTEEINAGRKILIDGGADGGESTKEGTFTQRLPDEVDPTQYNGVSIWCEDFRVAFGSATLQ